MSSTSHPHYEHPSKTHGQWPHLPNQIWQHVKPSSKHHPYKSLSKASSVHSSRASPTQTVLTSSSNNYRSSISWIAVLSSTIVSTSGVNSFSSIVSASSVVTVSSSVLSSNSLVPTPSLCDTSSLVITPTPTPTPISSPAPGPSCSTAPAALVYFACDVLSVACSCLSLTSATRRYRYCNINTNLFHLCKRRRPNISLETRNNAIRMLAARCTTKEVVDAYRRAESTIQQLRNKYNSIGATQDKPRSGRLSILLRH